MDVAKGMGVAFALALVGAAPALAFPVRQALPDGGSATLEVDPALLPAFGLPPAAQAPEDAPLHWSALGGRDTVYDAEPALRAAIPLDRPAKVKTGDRAARALGLKDGRSYGDTGRWYLYAGAGRQTVGLNLLNAPGGGLRRDGLSLDGLGLDKAKAEAGFAWRRGNMQASLGYARDKTKGRLMGVGSRSDDRVGLNLSWRAR